MLVLACWFLGGPSLPEVVFHHLEIFPDISFGEKCLERLEKALGIWQAENFCSERGILFCFCFHPVMLYQLPC